MATPSRIPTTTARPYPMRNSVPLTRMSFPSTPSCSIRMNVETIRVGELVKRGLTCPSRTTPSQATTNSVTAMVPMARARAVGESLPRRGRGAGASRRSPPAGSAFSSSMRRAPQGRPDLFLDQAPDVVLERQELRRALDAQRARARKVDRDDALDPPRPGRVHHHPIRQVERLVDLMGDEDRRPAGFLPDAHQ